MIAAKDQTLFYPSGQNQSIESIRYILPDLTGLKYRIPQKCATGRSNPVTISVDLRKDTAVFAQAPKTGRGNKKNVDKIPTMA